MNLLALQADPSAFRSALRIDTDAGPRPLEEVLDGWQRTDFAALDPAWRKAAGQPVEGDVKQRAWLERPRGHSKSSDVMLMACWALFAARKPLAGIVCAVDRDQAGIDRDHVARLVALNPWLGKVLDVQQWRVVNRHTGSAMDIIASDVASSYGLLIDFAVLDEVTIWPKRDLFDSIFSSAAKRSSCLLLCIGNAGFQQGWQWGLREQIRTDAGWYFGRLEGAVASWITPANLTEQARLLPPNAYARLWSNIWVGAGGDALSPEAINRAFVPGLTPHAVPVPGWQYTAGLDLGIVRDASALAVVGVYHSKRSGGGGAEHGRVRLAFTKVWRPRPGQRVDLQEVENAVAAVHERFGLRALCYDAWQAVHLAQRLQAIGLGRMAAPPDATGHVRRMERLPLMEVQFTGKALQNLATVVLEAFNDGRLELFEDADLRRDLERLRVEERPPHGFRLVSPRDSLGHGDLFTAFSLALLAASERAGKRVVRIGAECGPTDRGSGLQRALAAFEREAAAVARARDASGPEPRDLQFAEALRRIAPDRFN